MKIRTKKEQKDKNRGRGTFYTGAGGQEQEQGDKNRSMGTKQEKKDQTGKRGQEQEHGDKNKSILDNDMRRRTIIGAGARGQEPEDKNMKEEQEHKRKDTNQSMKTRTGAGGYG